MGRNELEYMRNVILRCCFMCNISILAHFHEVGTHQKVNPKIAREPLRHGMLDSIRP